MYFEPERGVLENMTLLCFEEEGGVALDMIL